ncbi:SDR family NAD(P)-dependent oxidoreductase [Novosphingobium aquae]|uniref:SDR family NAD(P)-dependent oxidoreductase n=1 Tax=Novosphingobium aquae TaxID=3133435 RepID=A0ABU8S802_9SPHN
MTISYEGQVVVVTGAGGGLGRTYAIDIARRGGMVVVNDLGGATDGSEGNEQKSYADAVVDEIRAAGGIAVANYDNVAGEAGGKAIIQSALDHYGRIDCVIANAGTMRYGPFEDLTLGDLNALLAVHVGGSWNVAQAAWPHMKAQGYGRLVFTTSSGGMLGNAALAAYGAAKGGVMGLTLNLALAGAPHGILCNAIMPNAMSRMTMEMDAAKMGNNPWSRSMWPYFDPGYTTGLVSYLASNACTTNHGIYSMLGGRLGRTFIGVCDGYAQDAPMDAETVAAHWDAINDTAAGFGVPANNADEFRIVAELRGLSA